jgi:hypothetical protein
MGVAFQRMRNWFGFQTSIKAIATWSRDFINTLVANATVTY